MAKRKPGPVLVALMPDGSIEPILEMAAVADRLGVAKSTVQRYLMPDRTQRWPFPAPAGHVGRTPWWVPSQIDAWIPTRPGMSGPSKKTSERKRGV